MQPSSLYVSISTYRPLNLFFEDPPCPVQVAQCVPEQALALLRPVDAGRPQSAQVTERPSQGQACHADAPLHFQPLADRQRLLGHPPRPVRLSEGQVHQRSRGQAECHAVHPALRRVATAARPPPTLPRGCAGRARHGRGPCCRRCWQSPPGGPMGGSRSALPETHATPVRSALHPVGVSQVVVRPPRIRLCRQPAGVRGSCCARNSGGCPASSSSMTGLQHLDGFFDVAQVDQCVGMIHRQIGACPTKARISEGTGALGSCRTFSAISTASAFRPRPR